MSLHFALMVNHETIGQFDAQRIADMTMPNPGTEPDSINRYNVDLWRGLDTEKPYHHELFKVDHRYGDGAWELVRKSIAQSSFTRAPKRLTIVQLEELKALARSVAPDLITSVVLEQIDALVDEVAQARLAEMRTAS